MLWQCLLLLWAQLASAQHLKWHFDLSWVQRDPSGHGQRPMIGINGQWPLPTLYATEGDFIEVTVCNHLNETTTVHFHGIHFRGANQMDGASMVTQCPIAPGGSYTYRFQVNQSGTYWYHSHMMTQYGDGLRGVFVVRPKDPVPELEYDEETVMSLTDYYQCLSYDCLQQVLDGQPLKEDPVSVLMNEQAEYRWQVKPNTTYLVHLANMGVEAGRYLYFEDHELTVVEVDGGWVEPRTTKFIHTLPGQRVSFLVRTKPCADRNYIMGAYIDQETVNTPINGTNQTNWMIYDSKLDTSGQLPYWDKFDDVYEDGDIVPLTQQPLLANPNISIKLDVNSIFRPYAPGSSHSTNITTVWEVFNNHTYSAPKVPTLHTAVSAPANLKLNPAIYGSCIIPYVLPYGSVVDVTMYGLDRLKHPMHGHGHSFQVVEKNGQWFNESNPPLRDTVGLDPNGSVTLRFRADNPGVWLFHCHLEYHMDMGLGLTFIEAPDHIEYHSNWEDSCNCRELDIPSFGNVVGATSDWTNDRGFCKDLWAQ